MGEVGVELWEAEREEMLDIAERFADLDDDQWNSPSLCGSWRIRDVLAHLTAGAQGAFGVGVVFRGLLRHGFNYNRWVVLEALRDAAADRPAGPGRQPVRGLMHVLIHGQDMCRPLGIRRAVPEAHLVPVADFVKNDVHIFGAKRRIAGLKLVATDMDWSHGIGPEVAGPAEALVMMMAGRLVALNDLAGEGKVSLVSRR